MKFFSEKTYHYFFKGGVIIKALISLGEIIFGFVLYFLNQTVINTAINFFTGGELQETPRDFLWNLIFHILKDFSATPQLVWAFIFLSHGIVKIFLIGGLLREKLWAYPASAVIFAAFVIYQIYQLSISFSVFLWFITIFDIALIGLILREYKNKRNNTSVSPL
jgi:uncharacterized membrane protein